MTSSDAPFYHHRGKKVYLQVDSSQLVVNSSDPSVTSVVASAVALSGAQIQQHHALGGEENDFLFRLGGSTGPALRQVVTALRKDDRMLFVSPVYTTVASGAQVIMVNNLDVRFGNGVPAAQVDRFALRQGLIVLRAPFRDAGYDAYRFRYPPGADPLKLAVTVHENPLVQWSSPGFIGDVKPASVPNDPL